ncbi:hypothetical protein [Mycobacterium deserti]|uniref:DUF3786 domain-containing protein n=1 Tax=Mycobacterium deserti TaxID=2978347 RepID=A0ABT2MGD9_9MYCO|nr:hypothetical protein [Mycobacterium deserti]MCT7661353.1 hypothetical protein [Mycobacterium deserti]
MTSTVDGSAPPAATRGRGATAFDDGSLLTELRQLSESSPTLARQHGWEYLRELGRHGRRDQLKALYARGVLPERLDGPYEGLIVGKLFGIVEAHLANPLLAINPTWRGKTFDAESGTGFNRLIPLARFAMRVVAPLYNGVRRIGPEVAGFHFQYGPGVGAIAPAVPVCALNYGVEQYRNPSVRTFPIKRTRDEIVELLPGLYLGRALLTMRSGEVRLIAYFALRRFVEEDVCP